MLIRKVLVGAVSHLNRCTVRQAACRHLSVSGLIRNNRNETEEEEIEQNPFFDKYAEKIKKAQADAKQFDSGRELPRGDARLRRETEQWKRTIEQVEDKLSEKKKEEENRRGSKLPSSLGDLIHMYLFHSKNAEEISAIWTEHFKDKDAVSAIIPSTLYQGMVELAVENPTFLYPLPKEQGYEFYLSQFDGNRCFFTSLINFQVHGENAPWQFCMTFYPELSESHHIVLMTSEIDQSALNIFEAQCLSQLQKLFYVNPDATKAEMLSTFNKNPDAFKYMDLVKELESSNMVVKS